MRVVEIPRLFVLEWFLRGRSLAGLKRRAVNPKIAGSNPVGPVDKKSKNHIIKSKIQQNQGDGSLLKRVFGFFDTNFLPYFINFLFLDKM